MNDISLSAAEQEELSNKIRLRFETIGYDDVLVFGSSNITYLSCGIVFPYMDQKIVHQVAYYMSVKTGQRVLFCTFELADIPDQLNWDGDVVIYSMSDPSLELSLAKVIATYIGEQVAIDENYITTAQLSALQQVSNDTDFIGLDDALDDLKLCKTGAEVRLLEIAGRMGDRGFVSALNHTEGAALDTLSYPVWEYAERFRVHAGEFGGSGVGNISVLQGKAGIDLYGPCPPRAIFNDGEFVRLEYSMHNHGYWIIGSRTVYVGTPDQASVKAYQENQLLKRAALDELKVGTAACDVHSAVMKVSSDRDIPFWQDTEIGHGVGTSEREAPFLAPYDPTILAEGMIVCVGIYTYGPNKELICDRDVYHLTTDGPKLLTWYKTYDQLYAMFGTSARHG